MRDGVMESSNSSGLRYSSVLRCCECDALYNGYVNDHCPYCKWDRAEWYNP